MELTKTNLAREIIKRPDIIDFLKSNRSISDLFEIKNDLAEDRLNLYKRLYKGVGNTPCYITNLPNNNTLYLKLEHLNSMGNNHYSRFWIPYLFLCEALNIIKPGITKIIEVTSGSSGISLSLACKYLGYDLFMVIPDSLPRGRKDPMENNHAKLITVPGYIDSCILKLQELVKSGNYFAANHSDEKSNLITYIFKRIAIEHYNQFGIPDYCILGLGNGSSTYAIANFFKNIDSRTKVISYHSDIAKNKIILGLLPPRIPSGLLKHVKHARQISDQITILNESEAKDTLEYFKFDSEIATLGLSTIYGISIALKLSFLKENLTIFSIGFDNIYRYYG